MKIYNKLVRDRIPELIANCGRTCVTQIITDKSVRQELLRAKLLEEYAEYCAEPSLEELSKAYLEAEIVGEKWIEDTLHVACATYYRADAIVSWNFKHIVRLDNMKAYNLVNAENGYGLLSIISPKEVQFDE
ncbi:MAG: hypothetical protein WCP79_15205 [Bacillota bacterium]